MCMWASTKPVVCAYGVAPFPGVPVAFSSASGNTAQPLAGTNVNVSLPPTTSLPPCPVERVGVRRRVLDGEVRGRPGLADQLGVAGVDAEEIAGLAVEHVAAEVGRLH